MKKRYLFTFPPELVQEPIIWQLGRTFAVVTNIRRADVEETHGWVVLELEGSAEEIERAVRKGKNGDPQALAQEMGRAAAADRDLDPLLLHRAGRGKGVFQAPGAERELDVASLAQGADALDERGARSEDADPHPARGQGGGTFHHGNVLFHKRRAMSTATAAREGAAERAVAAARGAAGGGAGLARIL